MRCARCGNDNPGTNRFCGMCGATLLRPPVGAPHPAGTAPPSVTPAPPSSVAASAPAAPPVATASPAPTPAQAAPEPRLPVSEEAPVISGPSFLGLNEPAPSSESRRRGGLSIDPSSAPSSRSLDYLLHDDEPRGGGTKYVLIALALALAIGLGYLRFKNQGLAWLKANTTKPPAAQTTETPDSTSTPPPASSTVNPPPSPATNPPAAATGSTTPPDSSSAAPSTAPTNPSPTVPAADNTTPPSSTPATGDTSASATPPVKTVTPPAPAKDTSDPNIVPAPTEKPKSAPRAPKPSPAAKPSFDPVAEAQNYIYGRGVRQDCERGMRLLKPQADQSNPKAMIEMGALYSAGLCTPRDLPTAYRWFALALRKDPDNQSVQTDLQKLWGEMTQPERQLAIRLSQ